MKKNFTQILRSLSVFLVTSGAINAQQITTPSNTALSIQTFVDVVGGLNIKQDSAFKIGGKSVLSNKGVNNMAIGEGAGAVNTGNNNFFAGKDAGIINSTGNYNLFLGARTGISNTTGHDNMFMGTFAGYSNVAANFNAFIGVSSGASTTSGGYNTFIGSNSGLYNTIGTDNLFMGYGAGLGSTTGINNVFLGSNAGGNNVSGSNNVFIGYNSYSTVPNITNATAIGAYAQVTQSNSIVLGSNANVGIGNTAPNAKLEITAGVADKSGLRFTNLTSATAAQPGGAGKALSVDASGNVILVGITGAGVGTTSVGGPVAENWKEADGYLYNNSTNGVVIKGTGLDGNALIVKGGVLSKEVNVKVEGSEAWPDYVFKPNYKRMTLGEVEKFIAINGHLPNVPSAAEMAANGNNLGKTDAKLLEKVEELTLYLLEMKKANDAQAAELKSLKQQVSKLRKK